MSEICDMVFDLKLNWLSVCISHKGRSYLKVIWNLYSGRNTQGVVNLKSSGIGWRLRLQMILFMLETAHKFSCLTVILDISTLLTQA